jgi:hypothetical protein
MTPEMQVIQYLIFWLIFTGFITGIFFSHRLFDFISFAYRLYKWRKRKKRASVYE